MNKLTTIVSVILVLVLSGCASSGLQEKLFQLQAGATKDRVLEILGVPGDRSFQGANEAWQYCEVASGGFSNSARYSTLWFSDGIVTAVTTDSRIYNGLTCGGGFGPVDWGQLPPDSTIEIRNR